MYLHFACQPACHKTLLCYVRACTVLKITISNSLLCLIYNTVAFKPIFSQCHSDSFILHSIAFFSID